MKQDNQDGTLGDGARHAWTRDRWPARTLSKIIYGTSLRFKLILPVLAIVLLVVGALSWFAFVSLHASITSIYEQRARSAAEIISKSIQESDYILYYSDELDADVDRLLARYPSIVDIRVIGLTARGYVTVASSDPTQIGAVASEEERLRYETARDVRVASVRIGAEEYLRAFHPIYAGPDSVGVVVVDMSLDEQEAYVRRLSWQFGVGAVIGMLLLGLLLYGALTGIVTRPVRRLAAAMGRVEQRDYDAEVESAVYRVPGMAVRDDVSRLVGGFNRMTRVISSHEQELKRLMVLDEVTGLYNLAHFREHLDLEISKGSRYGHPTSMIVVDLSHPDPVDSEKGVHLLVKTASFLLTNLRRVDTVFRTGEVQFAALLPETPLDGARIAAERLRTYAPDVASAFSFHVELSIRALGWAQEDAPSVDAILRDLSGEDGGPTE